MNDELANSLDRLAWLNAELANSMGRSSAASDSQVKAWVCLKAGRLELTAQIVRNTRLPAHPAIEGRGAVRVITGADISRRAELLVLETAARWEPGSSAWTKSR